MAQANFTPIQLYRSTTASAEPIAGNLADGELAINTADGKLFYKNSGGAVRLLSIGYGSSTVTPTNGGVQYGTGSALALTAAGSSGQILRSNGAAAPTWENLSALGVSTISFGTTGLTPNSATSGAVTVAGTLATTNGGTGLTSFTANQVFYASSTSAVAQSSNLLYSGTDLTVYGITVGRGAGAVSTNTAVGASALSSNTSGSLNTGVGYQSLISNLAGANNTAVGYQSGYGVSSGASNTFVGDNAGASVTSGSFNTAVGRQAGSANAGSTGSNNSSLGYQALYSNTTASNNTAVGYQAGYSNTTGIRNFFGGYQAGYSSTGDYNTFVGGLAGTLNTGSENTALGDNALSASGSGSYNTALGKSTLPANTSGANNTAVGYQSLLSNTTASNNTAVGYQAGYSNTTAVSSTIIGYQAGFSNTVGGYNVFIGLQAGQNSNPGGNGFNTCVGTYAGQSLTTGTANTFVGAGPNSNSGGLITTGSKNTIIGAYNGNQGGLDIRTASNYVVLSDGDGNPVMFMKTGQTVALEGANSVSGTGINFPATQNPSSNANTLDDYERGNWTPSLTSTGAATFTYGANTGGTYIKIGRWMYLMGVMNVATKSGGSSGDSLAIVLPISAGASDVSGSGVGYHISAATCTNLTVPSGYSGFPQGGVCTPNQAAFYPYWTDGANNRILQLGDIANGFQIQFSIAVFTNT